MNIGHVSFLCDLKPKMNKRPQDKRPDVVGSNYLAWHLPVRCPCGEVVPTIAFRYGWMFWYHEAHIHRRYVGTFGFWDKQVVLVPEDTVWTSL